MFACAFRFCCFCFCCGGGCGCAAAAAAAAAATTALLLVLLGVFFFFFQLSCENAVQNSHVGTNTTNRRKNVRGDSSMYACAAAVVPAVTKEYTRTRTQ